MKRFAKLTAAVAALGVVLALGLTGCLGGGGAKVDPTGTWELTEMVAANPEESVSADDIELLNTLGMSSSLEFKAGGTGVFTLLGESIDITWDSNGFKFADEGSAIPFSISGNQLIVEDGESKMIFTKVK